MHLSKLKWSEFSVWVGTHFIRIQKIMVELIFLSKALTISFLIKYFTIKNENKKSEEVHMTRTKK